MLLPEYCQHFANKLKNETIEDFVGLDTEGRAKKMLAIINKHHIRFTALRIFAVVFIYHINSRKGPTHEEILGILENKEIKNKREINYALYHHLASSGITKEQSKRFVLTQTFLSRLDSKPT